MARYTADMWAMLAAAASARRLAIVVTQFGQSDDCPVYRERCAVEAQRHKIRARSWIEFAWRAPGPRLPQ